MIRILFSLFFIINFLFSLSLENMVFSDSKGNSLDFIFYNSIEEAQNSNENAIWVIEYEYGYDIMYSTNENIAGFQFNLVEDFRSIWDYECINGQAGKNDFVIKWKESSNTIISFSLEGRTLPAGEDVLVEIRHHTAVDDLAENDIIEMIDNSYYDSACTLPENSMSIMDNYILYNSTEDVGGFQITTKGASINNVSGGDSKKSDFIVQATDNVILGFSLESKHIPKGCGVLLKMNLNGNIINLFDIVVSDTGGNLIDFTYHKKTTDNSSSEIDIIDIVISGRHGLFVDYEFLCHKDQCIETKPNTTSSNPIGKVFLSLESIGEKTWSISYDSDVDIAGFQFNVDGSDVIKSYGGDAEKNNFTTQHKNNLIISFSFQGDVIPAGKGNLIEFTTN